MSLAGKFQVKPGATVAVRRAPNGVDLGLRDLVDDPAEADAAVVFVTTRADLDSDDVAAILGAARRDAIAWVAYPKAGRLGTDLNRDSLAAALAERGVRPVRQIAVDEVWSALRFRPAG